MRLRRLLGYLFTGSCFLAVGVFVVFIWLFSASPTASQQHEAQLRTFQEAYPALAALPDFAYVSAAEDGSCVLHMADGSTQPAALAPEIASMLRDTVWLLDQQGLLGLRKTGDDVFFITGGAVDDEFGYVISSDGSVCMDGLWRLERADGHVYEFSTMK